MNIKHYKLWLTFLILGPLLMSIIYGIVGDWKSSDDPSGLEYLVTAIILVITMPWILVTGTIVTLLTRKSERHQLYSLIGFGFTSIPTMISLAIGLLFA